MEAKTDKYNASWRSIVMNGKVDETKVAETYDEISSIYDEILPIEAFYILLDEFYGLKLPKNSRVLDLCCGTGRLGTLLYEKGGYENVDALDCSKKSLELAKLNGHYKNIYHQFFTLDNRKEIADETYDVVFACHCFLPNHLLSKHFKEITRITKKGGHVVLVIRERYTLGDELSGFLDDVNTEVREKRWEPVIKPFKAEAVPGRKGPDGYLYEHIHYIMKIL